MSDFKLRVQKLLFGGTGAGDKNNFARLIRVLSSIDAYADIGGPITEALMAFTDTSKTTVLSNAEIDKLPFVLEAPQFLIICGDDDFQSALLAHVEQLDFAWTTPIALVGNEHDRLFMMARHPISGTRIYEVPLPVLEGVEE